jgi:hypothetical protein
MKHEIKGLAKGDSCTYHIRASCGGPSFKVDSSTTVDPADYGISYIEFSSRRYDSFRNI